MNGLSSAIQFLTIIPMGKIGKFDPQKMIPYFPIVGLILGTLVSVFDYVAVRFWPEPVAALLDVVFLVIVTGAFHLDGLGDTADGLYGHRPKEKTLAIMRDSRIGVMGLVAIVIGLAIKWAGISCLETHRSLMLMIIPAYARGAMIFGIRFLEYGRPDGGAGLPFFGETLKPIAFAGFLFPLALSIFLGWQAIWLNMLFGSLVAVILRFYHHKIGCITGDMLGAMAEVTEASLFLLVPIGWV